MTIYTLPFIAALIGWITNYLAIKMLFHPKKEVKLVFFSIQGIFPKRQKKLAEKLGTIVAKELISVEEITSNLQSEEGNAEISNLIESKIDEFLKVKLKEAMPMMAMFMSDDLLNKIKMTLLTEVNAMIPVVIEKYVSKIENNLDIEEIVKTKVENFSSDKLETILYSIMQKEFRFIEIVGAILGFVIGTVQVFLLSIG